MDRGPVDKVERTAARSERPEKIRLGELLVELRMITTEQLRDVLEQHLKSGKKVGRVLLESGYITEPQLAQAIAKLYRSTYVDLKGADIPPELVKRLPEGQARHHKAIVLEDRGKSYLVGFVDPSDLLAQDQVARLLKRDIDIAVVADAQLQPVFDKAYRKVDQISGLVKDLETDLGDTVTAGLQGTGGTDDSAVAKLVSGIFEDAVRLGASDVHIEPLDTRLVVRFRVDGILHEVMSTDPKISSAVLVRVKVLAGLNISEKRLPQDGRFNLPIRGHAVDVRLSTLPVQNGESAVMRILSADGGPRKLDKSGMPEKLLERFRAAFQRSSGLILVTGPTGSGKTTTLYSALNELNSTERKIVTAEDPVEFRIPGLMQVQVNERIDLSFSTVLRSVLRQDPDVILVGEMRDQETASIGLRAAITGHLVFSTLHTRDAAGTPMRLIDMGVPPVMVASALAAVIAQRLVRQNCGTCTAPYEPREQELVWLRSELGEVPEGARFMKGKGCANCSGTGYSGRLGLYELLEMTPELVSLVNRNDPDGFARSARAQLSGETMQCHGLRLAAAGKTTIAEVMRVASNVGD